jgi:hypothetical protein
MKYTTATEQNQPNCLPPEAYIQLLRNVKNEGQPKFMSSVYPAKIKSSNSRRTNNAK